MALNNLTRIGNSGFGTDTSINTTGIVTAASFSGDGSGLTGVTATGSGVVVQEEGSNVGTAQTINFVGTGVTATISGGIASVEIATSGSGGGGGLSDVVSDTTPQLGGNLDLNSKNITGTGNINITGVATVGLTTVLETGILTHDLNVSGVSTFSSNVVITAPLSVQSTDGISLDSGANSTIKKVNNDIALKSTSGSVKLLNSSGGAAIDAGGDQRLYSSGNLILNTISTGLQITGRVDPIADSTHDLGTNSVRWRNVYADTLYGNVTGTATTATNVTVANEASDTECFVMFGVNATGDNAPKSSSSLKYNSSTGGLSAGSFIGDGSGLTGITASGSGVIVRDGGSLVGTAGTIDFGSNVSVSPISAGVVTVTASAGSIPGINTSGTTEVNNLTATGVITATSFNGNGASVTNVNAVSIGGTPLTDLQKKNADTDLVMFNQILHFGPANTKSRIRWSGTTSLWDLIDGDLKIRDNTTDRFTFERTTGNFSASNVNVSGIITATTFSGSGASLTTLNASELDSGTIPDARFPSTLPAISGANLTNLPSDTPADTDVQVTYDVSSNGSSAYRFTGPGYSGADDNPDIYLVRGQRYRFINGTGSSHPFRIQSDTSGTAYTDGVSGSQSGTQDFNVQHDAPTRLYYQCTVHSGMIGNIYIVGGSDWRMSDVATNATPEIYTDRNVGIGTDNPNAELQINSDGFATLTLASARTTATDNIGGVGFATYFNGTQDRVASMNARVDGTFIFKNTTSDFERLRIRPDGDVVIGTSDLESSLDSRRRLAICDTTNGALLHLRGQSPAIYFDQSGGNTPKMYLDNAGLEIWSHTPASAGTNVFKIDSNGYRSFSTQPYVLLRKDGTTVSITADARVQFDTTVTSEGGMTVNSTRSRITVPKAGKYAVLGAVAGSNTTVSVGDGWRLDLYRDGGVYGNAYTYPINSTGASTGEEYTLQTSLIVPADANDYFEFYISSVGSARANIRYGYFCVYYLG